MDSMVAAFQVWVQAHPFLWTGIIFMGTLTLKRWVLNPAAARAGIRRYFAWQIRELRLLGLSEAQIDSIMESEAETLMAAAQEAKDESDKFVPPPADPPPVSPA